MSEPIRILAVDDEKFNLLLLQSCLKNEDVFLKTSDNPSDALATFKQQDFDVILLDIMMKGIDGFELRKLIRELNDKIPIIFLTSMVDDINSSLLNMIAADQHSYYMNKSFTKATLMQKITEAYKTYKTHKETDHFYHNMEENLELAGEVQRVMLPSWCISSVDAICSYLYLPSQQVSGDMLDIFTANGKHFMFIGDIAGHGVQAALYMSAMQSFLKVMLLRNSNADLKPHEILNALDSFLRNDLGGKNYMTCIVAIFDFKNNHLAFQNAGHPMLVRAKSSGEAKSIDTSDRGGLPVALGPRREYIEADTVELTFDDDDMFVFYTDGILDISNPDDEMAGETVFSELLGALVQGSTPISVPYRLKKALEQIGYDKTTDDISIAIVKKRSQSPYKKDMIIHADTSAVSAAAEAFEKFVSEHTKSVETGVKIALLISEFMNNIVLHGFKSANTSQTDIYVELEVDPAANDEITVRILDRSKIWNSPQDITIETPSAVFDRKNEEMPTSGRGMAIIHSITSRVTRNNFSGLNETVFIVPVQQVKS